MMERRNTANDTPAMPSWKRWLLATYFYGSAPYRSLLKAQYARHGKAPIIVLFYHRVADDCANRWTISNAKFSKQIDFLQSGFDLVSLEEAQRRVRQGRNDRPTVSVTFDDGYADNCQQALPLLIQRRIPCTYFVTTKHLMEGTPFPHDVTQGQPLRPNTLEQVKALAASGIEIGAHTRNHADLGKIHNPRTLHDEVVTATEELQAALERPVRYFSFPFGLPANLNVAAFRLAREFGFDAVCSAYGGYNFPGEDAFHLQRIHADNDLIRFKNWLTVDPRKLSVQRFQYETDDTESPELSPGYELEPSRS